MSLGIPLLTKEVRDAFTKKEKALLKTLVSDKPNSNIDYDPTSNIDNHFDSDDDSNDLNNDEVNDEMGMHYLAN
jgi:hypothetical protein